jgi:predicted RNase H-like HicB family nuclease
MTSIQKKSEKSRSGEGLPIVTDLVDPRPRRLVKFLNDYRLLRATASSSVSYTKEARGALAGPTVRVQLNRLPHKILKVPLDVLVEPDEQGFLARTPDLPLYGYGQDRIEAIDMLKSEIESLFDDLLENNHLSAEWLNVKTFLKERIES